MGRGIGGGRFAGRGRAPAAGRVGNDTANDINEPKSSWLLLLPPSVVHLDVDRVPMHFSHLPGQLRSLRVFHPSNTALPPYAPHRESSNSSQPSDLRRKSSKWPSALTSLDLFAHFLTPAESSHLPSSLTTLSTLVSADWTQENVTTLLTTTLPSCFVKFKTVDPVASAWITGPSSDQSQTSTSTLTPPIASSLPDLQQEATQEDVKTQTNFDLLEYVTRQLSSVPKRINAQWAIAPSKISIAADRFGSQHRSFGPQLPPLSVPLASSFLSASLPRQTMNSFSLGTLYTSPASSSGLISDMKNLESISTGTSPTQTLESFLADKGPGLAELSWFTPFQNLATLKLGGLGHLAFSQLPRTLTSLEVKVINQKTPDSLLESLVSHIATKERQKTPEFVTASTSCSFGAKLDPRLPEQGSFQEEAAFGNHKAQSTAASRPNTIADLPRGLTRCSIRGTLLDPPNDLSLWPPGLTDLEIDVYAWEDTQILEIPEHLPKLQKLGVSGPIVSFGVLDREKVLDYIYQKESAARGPFAFDSKRELLADENDTARNDPLTTPVESKSAEFGSLAELHWPNMSEKLRNRLKTRLEQREIEFHGFLSFSVPSLLTLAWPRSTESIILTTENKPNFKLSFATQQEKPTRLFNPPKSYIYGGIRCRHALQLASLRSYVSLTSLEISIAEIPWAALSHLPQSLKHLACCILEPNPTADPFHNCPRQLESLCIDAVNAVTLTNEGIPQLPPNLTTLECNRLFFSPYLIDIFPQKISTLLFDGSGTWSDAQIYHLATQRLETVKSVKTSHCVLTGALVPLDRSITELTTANIMSMTKKRLGELINIHPWAHISIPLRLCELDLLSANTSNLLESASATDLSHITSIDISQTLVERLSTLFPGPMPARLTSLSISSISQLSPADLVFIPQTLTSLTWTLCGTLNPARLHHIWPHYRPASWRRQVGKT